MYYVLGSGPAGVACAAALIRAGREVTVLDVGHELEPARQAILDGLSQQSPEEWASEDLVFLRGGYDQAQGKIHSKLTYGSAFPYADPEESVQEDALESPFRHSFARGGFSRVWGASLLPARAADIEDWPVPLSELEPHYRAVMEWMPTIAGEPDGLKDILPTYARPGPTLRLSRQIESFVADLARSRSRLARAGIRFGRSRQAVYAAGRNDGPGCALCGLCLYGCPYGLIYSSTYTLEDLIATGRVHYQPGYRVERLSEKGGWVSIHTTELATHTAAVFRSERVFVASGILPTAWLVLRSREAYGHTIVMKDSQYFIYPFLRLSKVQGVGEEALYDLAQLYVEIDDPHLSQHLVHLEVFSYSDYLKQALMETPLRLFLKYRKVADEFLGRLLVLQCFLHSDDSRTFTVTLRRGTDGQPRLRLETPPGGPGPGLALRVGLKLLAEVRALRGMPILPGLQFAEPGRSYHSGGGFPMRAAPGPWETDRLGRLPGWERIHLVDASIFPSIPATTMTFTVMSNAHRIGYEAAGI